MRILQVVHSLPFLNQAGTEVYAYDLGRNLSRQAEVAFFTRGCDRHKEEYSISEHRLDGTHVYVVNNTFRDCGSFEHHYEDPAIDAVFRGVLEREDPDVIHVHHLIFLSAGLLAAAQARGKPVVFTLHDYWLACPRWHMLAKGLQPCRRGFSGGFDTACTACLADLLYVTRGAKDLYHFCRTVLPGPALRWLKNAYLACKKFRSSDRQSVYVGRLQQRQKRIKELLESIRVFFAPSEFIRDRFIEFGIPPAKIRLSRYGLDMARFSDTQKTRSYGPRFGFIGTLLPAKGAHTLIRAFSRLGDPRAQLKIYGKIRSFPGFEGYLPYLKSISRDRRIKFMGEFDHGRVQEVFREMDVLVVPSLWEENSPLVILEACASRTPVIASRIGGIPELVGDSRGGLLFDAADEGGLLEKLDYCCRRPQALDELRNGLPQPRTLEDDAGKTMEVYTQLTNG